MTAYEKQTDPGKDAKPTTHWYPRHNKHFMITNGATSDQTVKDVLPGRSIVVWWRSDRFEKSTMSINNG